jgi:hypothetical protein
MATPSQNAEIADRFGVVAGRFCSIVDSARSLDRTTFVSQVYRVLLKLIDEAIGLQDVDRSDNHEATRGTIRQRMEEWNRLYTSLKDKLGEWEVYRQVFDPTQDTEAVHGSLADDIADIYRDLKEGLVRKEANRHRPEDLIWEMATRLLFSLGQARNGRSAGDSLPTARRRRLGWVLATDVITRCLRSEPFGHERKGDVSSPTSQVPKERRLRSGFDVVVHPKEI